MLGPTNLLTTSHSDLVKNAAAREVGTNYSLLIDTSLTCIVGAVRGSGNLNSRMRIFVAFNQRDKHCLYYKDDSATVHNAIDSKILAHFESETLHSYLLETWSAFCNTLRAFRH
jgi:hypothetical protein